MLITICWSGLNFEILWVNVTLSYKVHRFTIADSQDVCRTLVQCCIQQFTCTCQNIARYLTPKQPVTNQIFFTYSGKSTWLWIQLSLTKHRHPSSDFCLRQLKLEHGKVLIAQTLHYIKKIYILAREKSFIFFSRAL